MTHKTCPACGNGLDDNGDRFYCPGCSQPFTPEQVASGVVRQPDGAGIFAATYEAIAEALRLPEGVRIVGVRDEPWRGTIEIAMRGPGLPPCNVGQLLPQVCPVYQVEYGGDGTETARSVTFRPLQTEAEMLRAEVERLRAALKATGKVVS